MTIHLDTSALIEILSRTHPLLPEYQAAAAAGHRITVSTVTLYEWMRGPRTEVELRFRRVFFPDDHVVTFGIAEAARAAQIYRELPRRRNRVMDIAIGACALEHDAAVWTLNPDDFTDIPDLQLYVAPKTRLS